jgi:hypothetical protein
MTEQHETDAGALRRFWKSVKKWIWKYGGTLLMERKENGEYTMSLGRVALCVLLVQAMWKWSQATPEAVVDLPPGMKETLFFLMAYNFGSKGLATAKAWIEGRRQAKASPP